MVQYCCVPGCRGNALIPGISLHTIPQNEEIRKKWIIKIRRDLRKSKVSNTMRVCSDHFLPSDYNLDALKIKRLKKNAVPSVFSFTSPKKLESKRQRVRFPTVSRTENKKSDRPIEQSKIALCGSDQDLKRDDHVNELHVEGSEIERFYVTRLSDGSVIKIDKSGPMLKTKAVPNITLDFLKYRNEKDSYRLSTALDPVTSNPKIIKINSSCIISKISNNSENEAVLQSTALDPVTSNPKIIKINSSCIISKISDNSENEAVLQKDSVSTGSGTFTFHKILENLHFIKKPNNWWSINSVNNFIMCARWNENYTADKRVVIDSTLAVKVFVENMEIVITDIMDITCIDDLSSLLEKVEVIA